MKISRNIQYILYGIITLFYGYCHWLQELFIYNIQQNNMASNIFGINITPNQSQIKSFILTCFISILYFLKDIYHFTKN